MTTIARMSVLAILAVAAAQGTSQAAQAGCCPEFGFAVPMQPLPVTRTYRIRPEFCPRQLVAMIPQFVPGGGPCASCGPYGIPPIYTAGNFVVVRQTPEVQERVAKYLMDLGAYVPPVRAR